MVEALRSILSNDGTQYIHETFKSIQEKLLVHFQTEEEVIFPVLDRYFKKGIQEIGEPVRPSGGPITVMLVEHKSLKTILVGLEKAISEESYQESDARAEHLSRLLRSHIFREDNVLFKVAESVLTPSEKHGVSLNMRKKTNSSPVPADVGSDWQHGSNV